MGGTSEAAAGWPGWPGWPGCVGGARRGRLHHFDGVVDIGQLDLHAVHQGGEIADRLAQGAQFAAHFVEARGEAHHRGGDLFGLVAQVLFDVAGDDGHAGIGAVGGLNGLARELDNGSELLVLRPLEIFDLLLQQGYIALQFLDFLAGAGRERGDRK